MKKLIFVLMICGLFAEKVDSVEKINITQGSKVLVYTNLFWAPCKEAKALLQSRGIDYSTKLVTFSKKSVNEMAKKTGGRTSVPQIFVDEKYFGGLLELKDYYKEK
mgnify:CR=1 FL=1